MKADMDKIKAHLKNIANVYNSAYERSGIDEHLDPGYDDEVQIFEDPEEDFKIFQHHFESIKNGNNEKTEADDAALFAEIILTEDSLNVKIFEPICYKVHQIMTSDQAYDKMFEHDFERAHHSVFNVNYR